MKNPSTTSKPVALNMTIGDVVEKFPDSADVMLGYGLHCVGCAVNPYETIEQGALGHGMSKETIASMLADINLAVTKQPDYPLNPEGITVSPRAIETLEAIAESEEKKGYGLKIKATKKAEGLEYFLDLMPKPEAGDLIMKWDGLALFIDKDSLELMKPSLIDYVKLEEGEGFKVMDLKPSDPAMKDAHGCGCGDAGCATGSAEGKKGCGDANCGC
jgi:iron-sulfur cluster assembly accessory protein